MRERNPWMARLACLLVAMLATASATADGKDPTIRMLEAAGVPALHKRMVEEKVSEMEQAFDTALGHTIDREHYSTTDTKRYAGILIRRQSTAFRAATKVYVDENMGWDKAAQQLYAPLCRAWFSPAEIEQMTSFYQTGLGKKIADQAPLRMLKFDSKFESTFIVGLQTFYRDQMHERAKAIRAEMRSACGRNC